MEGVVSHLVVDAVAFLRNVALHEIGEKIYTVKEVVDEIKDKQTKERLQVLPYELILRTPTAESIRTVSEFSKKTGDYPSLSATDIKVLALTHQLQVENVGIESIRAEPQRVQNKNLDKGSRATDHLPGFYVPSSKWVDTSPNEGDKSDVDSSSRLEDAIENDDADGQWDDDDDDNDEDEDSWVTPDNLQEAIKELGLVTITDKPVNVGCITADFAMQNVLLQMGLNVLAVDGKLIKQARTFILRCYGCLKTTTNMVSKFCPHCGNATLKRVEVNVNEDGKVEVKINFRRLVTPRGKRFSLPMPKGGKHSTDPILCADQPIPQNRLAKKALQKTDALNPDYTAETSPFAMNDIYSRSAQLRVNRCGKMITRNPNKVRGPGKARK